MFASSFTHSIIQLFNNPMFRNELDMERAVSD